MVETRQNRQAHTGHKALTPHLPARKNPTQQRKYPFKTGDTKPSPIKKEHVMKTNRLIYLCIAIGMTFSMQAQKLSHSLVGVWQMQRVSIEKDGNNRFIPQLTWKQFTQDNEFCTFGVMSEDGSTYLTNKGTYTITSDSTYTEFIQESSTAPHLQGKNNQLKYRLFGKNLLTIIYHMPGEKKEIGEIWKRVLVGTPTSIQKP